MAPTQAVVVVVVVSSLTLANENVFRSRIGYVVLGLCPWLSVGMRDFALRSNLGDTKIATALTNSTRSGERASHFARGFTNRSPDYKNMPIIEQIFHFSLANTATRTLRSSVGPFH